MPAWFRPSKWEAWDFKRDFEAFRLSEEVKAAFEPLDKVEQALANAQKKKYEKARVYRGSIADDINDEGRPLNLPPPKPPIAIPGIVGELVDACWQGAPWQIGEVAVASALSAMSLLCSRSYRHGSLGLSLYLLILAQTSTGKSFCFKANDTWLLQLQKRYEAFRPPHSEEAKRRLAATKGLIITNPGSAQGLSQHIANSPSTLWQADEFVDKIKLMTKPNPPAPIAQLQTELLALVEMSGPGRIYRAQKYSKRSNKIEEEDVKSASLTILATGTPEKFYDDMSSDLLTSGFLPRFTIMEYEGSLSQENENTNYDLDKKLVDKLMWLYDQSYNKNMLMTGELSDMYDVVFFDEAAKKKLQWWKNVCLRKLDDANARFQPTAGLWSRAIVHVIQVASLIAIGVNPHEPKIEKNHIENAIAIVRPSIDKICNRVETNQIGMSDDRRIGEIRRFMAKMYIGGYDKFKNYTGVKKELIDNGIIQMAIVRNYCKNTAAFRNHPQGSNKAFNEAYNDMLKYGDIKQVDTGDRSLCVTLNIDVFKDMFQRIKDEM
jgi:hypothetical protein